MDETDRAEIANDRARAERALDVVRRDLAATLPEAVHLQIDSSEGGTMWVPDDAGSAFGETISARDGAVLLLARVADCAQTVVMDAAGRTWPECCAHQAGLHVAIISDKAVWECRSGGHVVAAIGDLPDSK